MKIKNVKNNEENEININGSTWDAKTPTMNFEKEGVGVDDHIDPLNKKGITLIALIITIILMLILSGVVISLTLGDNGIFKLAKDASENYINAAEDEKSGLNNIQNNIDDVLKDNGEIKYSILASKAEVGDYVAYNAIDGVTDENLLTYTSSVGNGMSHGNGCSKTSDGIDLSNGQTFTANSNIRWRVLSKNKETGEVVLISEAPIKADNGMDFNMQGVIGYLYQEQELNEVCKIYGHGKGADTSKVFKYEIGDVIEGLAEGTITGSGARSINVEDINQITGYTPTQGQTYSHTILYPTLTTVSGVSSTSQKRVDSNTYYEYAASGYINNTNNIYRMLFRNLEDTSSISYWLASKASCNLSYAVAWNYRYVEAEKVTSFEFCNNADFIEHPRTYGVRPIVYLKSNIQTSGQDENGAWTIVE